MESALALTEQPIEPGHQGASSGAARAHPGGPSAHEDAATLLETLRRQNYNREEPAIYRLLRRVSIRLTFWLVPTGFSPNQVSLAGISLTVLAAGLIATGEGLFVRIGAALLLACYVLDCVDGELARVRNQSSRLGIHIEHLGNWIVVGLLQIGLAYGAYARTGDDIYLVLGMFSLLGWYGFYFLFIQMQSWISGEAGFSSIRKMSGVLVIVMPLDENIVLIGSALNMLPEAAWISSVLGVSLFFVSLTLFFVPVYAAHTRKRQDIPRKP